MTPAEIRALLERLTRQELSIDQAVLEFDRRYQAQPFEDLGFAKVDHHRAARQGFPEVILGLGKTPAQIAGIAERIAARGQSLLVTRADRAAFEAVAKWSAGCDYEEGARAITLRRVMSTQGKGTVLIAAAGTSDYWVAEEAAVTASVMGNEVDRLYDVGVAGLHRLLRELNASLSARVIIVVAGMEGALPSVVAGLVKVPVIGVPTSVGYGASFGGVAALLGMLNSCANGVSVVNIDNGFGGGCIASLINHLP